jgi:hypothetical protein
MLQLWLLGAIVHLAVKIETTIFMLIALHPGDAYAMLEEHLRPFV